MNLFTFTVAEHVEGAEPATLPGEFRLYWRGAETTCADAKRHIKAAGYDPLYVERIK